MITFILTQWKLVLAGVLAAMLGVQTVRLNHAHVQYAELKQAFAEAQAKAAEATRKAEQAAREEEQRRQQRMEEIEDEADQRTAIARAAAADADAAASRLRSQLAAFTARARSAPKDSGTAVSGPPADTALDLLAKLYSESSDAEGEISRFADASRNAGLACEAAYASLGR